VHILSTVVPLTPSAVHIAGSEIAGRGLGSVSGPPQAHTVSAPAACLGDKQHTALSQEADAWLQSPPKTPSKRRPAGNAQVRATLAQVYAVSMVVSGHVTLLAEAEAFRHSITWPHQLQAILMQRWSSTPSYCEGRFCKQVPAHSESAAGCWRKQADASTEAHVLCLPWKALQDASSITGRACYCIQP